MPQYFTFWAGDSIGVAEPGGPCVEPATIEAHRIEHVDCVDRGDGGFAVCGVGDLCGDVFTDGGV